MRLAGLVGVLVLAIGCVVCATSRRSPSAPPVGGDEIQLEAADPIALSDPGKRGETRTTVDPRASTRAFAYVPSGPKVRLHGKVVVTDEAGREHAPQTGTFKLWLRKDRP